MALVLRSRYQNQIAIKKNIFASKNGNNCFLLNYNPTFNIKDCTVHLVLKLNNNIFLFLLKTFWPSSRSSLIFTPHASLVPITVAPLNGREKRCYNCNYHWKHPQSGDYYPLCLWHFLLWDFNFILHFLMEFFLHLIMSRQRDKPLNV